MAHRDGVRFAGPMTTRPAWQVTAVSDADDPTLRDWYDVHAAAYRHDHGGLPEDPWPEFRARTLEERTGRRSEAYVLRAGHAGAVVGGAGLTVNTRDNLDVLAADIVVHPDHRRRGGGTALLAAVRRRATGLGATRLVGDVGGPVGSTPPGEAFARRHGGHVALQDVRRHLDMTRLDEHRLAGLTAVAWAHAHGYRLVAWTGHPPEAWWPDLGALHARMSTDPPQGELAMAPEVWDVDRVVDTYRAAEQAGRLVLGVAAVTEGRLVGYTEIGVSEDVPEVAYQWDTIVSGAHRGHRLGLLMKAENLLRVRHESPRTRWVHTWNAAENSHMVAVNETLGFTVLEDWTEWLLPVSTSTLTG